MFAYYKHDNSTSQANLKADILAILTGTTNPASLSADCVTADTTIYTTYAVAGWTLYDSAAYTNGFVVRALQKDGVTYKYVGIDITSTTQITMWVYESFNSGTHTGTNGISKTATWATGTVGYLYIYATAEIIAITSDTGSAQYFPLTCLELDNTLGTVISGYPTTFQLTDSVNGKACRIKNPNASGDLTTSSTFVAIEGSSSETSANMWKGRLYRNASETICMALLPPLYTFTYGSPTSSTIFKGCVGKALGGWLYGQATLGPVTLDTATIGGIVYICLYNANSANNYSGCFWVPRG